VIDITHGIDPQQVLQGALVLEDTLPYMPEGVHLAVVDPGVGTDRRGVVLVGRGGRLYVGPDNGLLVGAAERLGGIAGAHELASEAYRLSPVSRTFHARDVFAPAAAHLAIGLDPAELGPAVDPAALVRIAVPAPSFGPGSVRATVLSIDRFGNVRLNLRSEHLEQAGIVPGAEIELGLAESSLVAAVAETFADVEPGELLLYEDAYRRLALAVSSGHAAERLGARPGLEVEIRRR
jgi:S-adenosylmethionine hydrolase